MSKELSPKYNPAEVEAGRYQKWLEEDVFKPSGDKKAKPYSIVIPPPNVTGKLHLGHAWDTTLQDIIIRQKRMQGFDTLWLPGMDHAGIATKPRLKRVWLKMASLVMTSAVKNSLIKSGNGKMSMRQLSRNNGARWGSL